jgi:hypothetical protein
MADVKLKVRIGRTHAIASGCRPCFDGLLVYPLTHAPSAIHPMSARTGFRTAAVHGDAAVHHRPVLDHEASRPAVAGDCPPAADEQPVAHRHLALEQSPDSDVPGLQPSP